jgi:FlaA1/EpsC-like NDP-sugar epimerase
MIRLSGADVGDIEIVYAGLRRGGKLSEELLTEDGRTLATRFEQIMVAQTDVREDQSFRVAIASLVSAASQRDWDMMRHLLSSLYPGFELAHPDPTRTPL